MVHYVTFKTNKYKIPKLDSFTEKVYNLHVFSYLIYTYYS